MALYNNGFPVGYQQIQQQPIYQQPVYQVQPQMQGQQYQQQFQQQPQQQFQQQPQQQQTQQQSTRIWVQGDAGAKSYLVAPNVTVDLWDSERPTIYLKSADASGMPSMTILDYTVRGKSPTVPVVPVSENPMYALKDDVDALYSQISVIRAELDAMNKKPAPKPKKEAAESE